MGRDSDPVPGPGEDVLAAFGGVGRPSLLAGGQGSTFVDGDLVLKPAGDEAQATWAAQVLSTVIQDGFRTPRPIMSRDGRWVVDGWTAFERVDGEHLLRGGPWAEAIQVCGRFHSALARLPMPAFIEGRTDRFAEADRLAWDESTAALPSKPLTEMISRLRSMSRPISLQEQVIHGDVAGNLLFAAGLPPAVIDFSPYWRPGGYATAVMIVDAVLWYGEGVGLATHATDVPELSQLLLRALIFRLSLDGLLLQSTAPGVRWDRSQIEWDLIHAEPLVRHLADHLDD